MKGILLSAVYKDQKRFWSKVEVQHNKCWNWKAGKNSYSYGDFWLNGKTVKAHRFSYELFAGKIPNGLVIGHICKNRGCVNPHHLRLVTVKQNTLENSNSIQAINAKKTHCKRGHELTNDNIYLYKIGRTCKQCKKDYKRNKKN